MLWRNLAVAALLGVGALLRNQIVVVTGLLIVGFAIEPMLATLVPEMPQSISSGSVGR